MINFYNAKLAPWMLCKLLYDVVPEKLHRPVVFSYGRRHMPEDHKGGRGVTNYQCVWLNLEAIAFDGVGNGGSRRAGIWKQMLKTSFHEFAHIALEHWRSPYEEYWRPHEIEACKKAEEWIERILSRDDRLYQPDFLGLVDIIHSKFRKSRRVKNPKEINWWELKDYRCYVTGGQLSIGDVAYRLQRNFGAFAKKRRLIHKHGDDLARIHIDSAGRRHHFWVWGDLPIIAQRLAGEET